MKRTELTVGAELYWAEPGDWRDDRTSSTLRVVVVAVEPHHFHTRRWDTEPTPVIGKARGGTADVLVDQYRHDGQPASPARALVRLADLRGPYAETYAAVQQRAAERDARNSQEAHDRKATRDAIDAAVRRARLDGLHSVQSGSPWHTLRLADARIDISLAEFEGLLNQLDEARQQVRGVQHEHTCGCATPFGPGCAG